MAPRKATAWPAYIFDDPAVQKLDEDGRFIICGVCAEFYTVCGGKRPKPIVLNGCYRTRAWEVHKQRARAHSTTRSGSSNPRTVVPEATAAAASQSPPQSFGEMLDTEQQRDTKRLMDLDLSMATRDFNEPPPRDRRRRSESPQLSSPPTPAPLTAERHRPSHSRDQEHQHKTGWPRAQFSDFANSTLVFPLVRRRSQLRSWGDFDAVLCVTNLGYDWRRRPSSRRAYERRC